MRLVAPPVNRVMLSVSKSQNAVRARGHCGIHTIDDGAGATLNPANTATAVILSGVRNRRTKSKDLRLSLLDKQLFRFMAVNRT